MAKKDKKNTAVEKEKSENSVTLDKSEEKEEKKSKKEKVSEDKSEKKEKKDKKKSEKPEKKEPNAVAKWFKDLKIEFKKVVWPSKKTVIDNTSVVLAVVVLSAILVGLLDTGFLHLMSFIYQQG